MSTSTSPDQAHGIAARRLHDALEARDMPAVGSLLAPDVALHSPITGHFTFRGRDRIVELEAIVQRALSDLEHVALVGDGRVWAQFSRARVGSEPIEVTQLIGFDDAGLISELTIFVRPLPGLLAFFGALAGPVGARHSRATGWLFSAFTRPLHPLFKLGDVIAGRLLRASWS